MASAPGSERNAPILLATVTALSTAGNTDYTVADFATLDQSGARSNIMWIFESTAATDTPSFVVSVRTLVGAKSVTIASIGPVNATGTFVMSPAAGMADARDALLLPTVVRFARTTGTLTGNLYQYIGG